MFKVGDIVKTKYESGGGSFKVVEILNETHILVKSLDPDFDFNIAVKLADWDIDPIQYRKNKVTKILSKLK
jgi:hypothetical protein